MGSTETTFYVIAVYFGSVAIRQTHATRSLPALLPDLAGVASPRSSAFATWSFGSDESKGGVIAQFYFLLQIVAPVFIRDSRETSRRVREVKIEGQLLISWLGRCFVRYSFPSVATRKSAWGSVASVMPQASQRWRVGELSLEASSFPRRCRVSRFSRDRLKNDGPKKIR